MQPFRAAARPVVRCEAGSTPDRTLSKREVLGLTAGAALLSVAGRCVGAAPWLYPIDGQQHAVGLQSLLTCQVQLPRKQAVHSCSPSAAHSVYHPPQGCRRACCHPEGVPGH